MHVSAVLQSSWWHVQSNVCMHLCVCTSLLHQLTLQALHTIQKGKGMMCCIMSCQHATWACTPAWRRRPSAHMHVRLQGLAAPQGMSCTLHPRSQPIAGR